jgi:hypothetical protein
MLPDLPDGAIVRRKVWPQSSKSSGLTLRCPGSYGASEGLDRIPDMSTMQAVDTELHVCLCFCEGNQVETQPTLAYLPVFYQCSRCGFYHTWGSPWRPTDCKPLSQTRFDAEDLDKQYPGGWIRRPQPNDGRGSFDEGDPSGWRRPQSGDRGGLKSPFTV